MDQKTQDQDKKNSTRGLLTEDEVKKLYTYYGGCMGAIALATLILYWLVGVLKGL